MQAAKGTFSVKILSYHFFKSLITDSSVPECEASEQFDDCLQFVTLNAATL